MRLSQFHRARKASVGTSKRRELCDYIVDRVYEVRTANTEPSEASFLSHTIDSLAKQMQNR